MNTKKIATLGVLIVFGVGTAASIAVSTGIAVGAIAIGGSCGLADWFGPGCIDSIGGAVSDDSTDLYKQDVENQAVIMADERQAELEAIREHLNQTYGMGMSKAKISAIEALNDGDSQSRAQTEALNSVSDFYSNQQLRLAVKRNREVLKAKSTFNRASEAGTGISALIEIQDLREQESNPCNAEGGSISDWNTGNTSIELYNGTTVELLTIEFKHTDNYGCVNWVTQYGDSLTGSQGPLHLKYGETPVILNTEPFKKAYNRLDSNYQRASDNVVNLSEDIYSNYAQGELSTSEVLGPLEALQQASTNYEDTGYYAYRALSLEQAGLATNDSYGFNVTYENINKTERTHYGQLFVANESVYNGKLEKGKTYDASKTSVFFVHENGDGDAVKTDLNGNFTINSMRDTETGEQVNETSIQSVRFRTSNTEDLQAQLERLRNQQQEIKINFGLGGLTGNFDLSQFTKPKYLVLVLTAAAALVAVKVM